MVSTCRWASRPIPSRYIEIIVTRTTETTIETLRRRPLPISPSKKPMRIRSPAPAELEPGGPGLSRSGAHNNQFFGVGAVGLGAVEAVGRGGLRVVAGLGYGSRVDGVQRRPRVPAGHDDLA